MCECVCECVCVCVSVSVSVCVCESVREREEEGREKRASDGRWCLFTLDRYLVSKDSFSSDYSLNYIHLYIGATLK